MRAQLSERLFLHTALIFSAACARRAARKGASLCVSGGPTI